MDRKQIFLSDATWNFQMCLIFHQESTTQQYDVNKSFISHFSKDKFFYSSAIVLLKLFTVLKFIYIQYRYFLRPLKHYSIVFCVLFSKLSLTRHSDILKSKTFVLSYSFNTGTVSSVKSIQYTPIFAFFLKRVVK